MAKKSRTPPPPRRPVQAPQRRAARNEPAGVDDARKLRALMLFAAAGLVGLAAVIVLIVLTSRHSGGKTGAGGVASAMKAAGCTYEEVAIPKPPKGQTTHISTLATPVAWNMYPPAGGQHYGQPAVWGFYTEVVDPKQIVHNEEHGGMVIWWGPKTPKSEIDKLQAFYTSSPNSMFGTPIGTIKGKSLGSKIALTAWTGDPKTYQRKDDYGLGHVAICPTFNESAFKKFRDAFRGKGPEGIPASVNTPGS